MDPSTTMSWLLVRRPLVGIGRISYGLYLYHLPIFELVQSLQLSGAANVALEWGDTAAVAIASWYGLEQPVQRWAHRRTAAPRGRRDPDRPVPARVLTPSHGVHVLATPSQGIGP